jgi:hypothetical protein
MSRPESCRSGWELPEDRKRETPFDNIKRDRGLAVSEPGSGSARIDRVQNLNPDSRKIPSRFPKKFASKIAPENGPQVDGKTESMTDRYPPSGNGQDHGEIRTSVICEMIF